MREEKNTRRSTVYIGFDGRVHKVFRGHEAEERFNNEVKVLKYLETRGCDFVPRLLDYDPDSLKIITSNAGKKVEVLSDEKIDEIYSENVLKHVRAKKKGYCLIPSGGNNCDSDSAASQFRSWLLSSGC